MCGLAAATHASCHGHLQRNHQVTSFFGAARATGHICKAAWHTGRSVCCDHGSPCYPPLTRAPYAWLC